MEHASAVPADRAEMEDIAAICAPDLVRNLHDPVPEVPGRGLEVRQWRCLDDDVLVVET